VTAKKQDGEAREDVEVLDVAQLLIRSVRRNITVVAVDDETVPPSEAAPVEAAPPEDGPADRDA
jgi:hypothetical protein